MENLSVEQLSALSSLNESEKYIYFVMASLCLSLKTIDNQKKLVINPENSSLQTEEFPLSLTGNLLNLSTAIYFYYLTKSTYINNENKENRSPYLNYTASGLVLIATFIRLYDIFYSKENGENPVITAP